MIKWGYWVADLWSRAGSLGGQLLAIREFFQRFPRVRGKREFHSLLHCPT